MSEITRRILDDGRWYVVKTHVGCCDCGLVHQIWYRTRNGKLEYKNRRDKRLTAESRRRFKYPFQKVK